jgi:hypothetical protein
LVSSSAPGTGKARDARFPELLQHRQMIPAVLLMEPAVLRDIIELYSPTSEIDLRPHSPGSSERRHRIGPIQISDGILEANAGGIDEVVPAKTNPESPGACGR